MDLVQISEKISLPLWVVYLGLISGIVAVVIQIVSFLINLFKRPTLKIKLTREVFFRLLPDGECLFANAILLPKNGTVEVKDVVFTLEKITGSKKTYVLNIRRVGKKVEDSTTVIAGHFFYTTSPITYLQENSIERPVYLAVLEEKGVVIQQRNIDFESQIQNYKNTLSTNKQIKDLTQEEGLKIFENIQNIKKPILDSIMESVQIEDGEYQLKVTVKYKPLGLYSVRLFHSHSSIRFTVDQVRDIYKNALENYFNTFALNILFPGSNLTLTYPEYTPLKVKEE